MIFNTTLLLKEGYNKCARAGADMTKEKGEQINCKHELHAVYLNDGALYILSL